MSNLSFVYHKVADLVPHRVIYTARDEAGRLYTVGLDISGHNGFAAVYDPASLETLYARTYFDCRMHADELKRALQAVADSLDTDHAVPAH